MLDPKILFFIFTILFASNSSAAQKSSSVVGAQADTEANAEKASAENRVTWYQPATTDEVRHGLKGIMFSGKARPKTKIFVKSREAIQIEGDGAKDFELSQRDFRGLPAQTNEQGLFEFSVFLPKGTYQIPFVFVSPDDKKIQSVFNLTFEITEEGGRVRTGDPASLESSPFLRRRNEFSLGLGGNVVIFDKSAPDIPTEAKFLSFQGPSIFAEYWRQVRPQWELAGSFKLSPGTTSSGSQVEVSQGQYYWTTLMLDAVYWPERWKMEKPDWFIFKYGLRGGIQYHLVPFLRSENVGSSEQEIISSGIATVSLGPELELRTSPQWSFHFYMHLQYPIAAGSAFDLESAFLFDGSAGARYSAPGSPWSYGVYWYGQYHTYQFSEYDKFTQADVDGKLNLFFSNIEFRVFYGF